MKTFMNTMVLAAVLGVAMNSGTAKADFDNNAVKEQAETIVIGVQIVNNAALRDAGVPRGQRVAFLAGVRSIAQDGLQIFELADGPDNQVEDEIEELARRMRQTAKRLADRADELDNDEVEDFFNGLADRIDDLKDEVN
jgi:ATP phosphoribosyltransferase regulatory subunit HisZ